MDIHINTIYNKGCGFNEKILQSLTKKQVAKICDDNFPFNVSESSSAYNGYELKMVIPTIVLYGLSQHCMTNTSSLKTLCKLGKYGLIDFKKKINEYLCQDICDDYQFMMRATYVCGYSMYKHISMRLINQKSLVRFILSFDVGFYRFIPDEMMCEDEFKPYYKKYSDKYYKIDWTRLAMADDRNYFDPNEPCAKIDLSNHSIIYRKDDIFYDKLFDNETTKKDENMKKYVVVGYDKIPEHRNFLKISMKTAINNLIKNENIFNKFSEKVKNVKVIRLIMALYYGKLS